MLDKLDTSTLGFPNAFPFQVSVGLRKLWLCHFVFLTWTWKQPRGAFCAGAPSLLSAKRSITLGKTTFQTDPNSLTATWMEFQSNVE
jgi:hypothetical protein